MNKQEAIQYVERFNVNLLSTEEHAEFLAWLESAGPGELDMIADTHEKQIEIEGGSGPSVGWIENLERKLARCDQQKKRNFSYLLNSIKGKLWPQKKVM